ncbi:MAG: hypothetical protein CVU61_00925 [Deltaproteobacteria bacterium HGW-Deltaproteobacteria-19]|nr:MAG: hypothetical protein CVU61_00925 [Deltaproteobacteria bacterium HGW-Deltaproteobacteria-19]
MEYRERTYRQRVSTTDLVSFSVQVGQTDLLISASHELTEPALQAIHRYRRQLEAYIETRPPFLKSLIPLEKDGLAPPIVRDMLEAAERAGVGPMAAVAGAVAERVGKDLLPLSANIIVENGGDIYIRTDREVRVGLFAGASPLSDRIFLKISPERTPLGICTSSGTVGPSLSLGRADAVTVISKSAALADAAATSIGNLVQNPATIKKGLERAKQIPGVLGVVIIIADRMGAWGEVELG